MPYRFTEADYEPEPQPSSGRAGPPRGPAVLTEFADAPFPPPSGPASSGSLVSLRTVGVFLLLLLAGVALLIR